MVPVQSPGSASLNDHHRLAAFPPPELPSFVGTMQPSDFLSSFEHLPFSDWLLILKSRQFATKE